MLRLRLRFWPNHRRDNAAHRRVAPDNAHFVGIYTHLASMRLCRSRAKLHDQPENVKMEANRSREMATSAIWKSNHVEHDAFGGGRTCTLSVHSRKDRYSNRPWLADAPQPEFALPSAYRRIMPQPLSIVHILVSGKASELRLSQQTSVLGDAGIREHLPSIIVRLSLVVEVPVGEQTGIVVTTGRGKGATRRRRCERRPLRLSFSPATLYPMLCFRLNY